MTSFRQLSVDIQATADQARTPGFEALLTKPGSQGLSFDSWDQANKALAGLAGKGIQVSILQRQEQRLVRRASAAHAFARLAAAGRLSAALVLRLRRTMSENGSDRTNTGRIIEIKGVVIDAVFPD